MELLHVLTHYENYNRNFTFSNFFIGILGTAFLYLGELTQGKGEGIYLF